MVALPVPQPTNRLGFHYFPDTLHYRDDDLETWLPQLQSVGASWLTIIAPTARAVPENFIRTIISAGIEPVLHFHLPLDRLPAVSDLRLLFETYARWGVRYTALFDRPNNRMAWPASGWVQSNLVERFLDNYLPLAEAAQSCGLAPVFSPLEPGGDYWDTAFLKGALQAIERRGQPKLLDNLILGAYAWTGKRRLDWGAGGPERWPLARPYDTPATSEDQRGFRIFEWYLTIARTVIEPAGVILLAAGARPSECTCEDDPYGTGCHARRSLAIAQLVAGDEYVRDPDNEELLEPIPTQVLACNFWLLSASNGTAASQDSWFRADGTTLPAVAALAGYSARRDAPIEDENELLETQEACLTSSEAPAQETVFIEEVAAALDPQTELPPVELVPAFEPGTDTTEEITTPPVTRTFPPSSRTIAHYVLLPTYDWGISDWHLEVIRPYVRKYRPTIGYSLEEAACAEKVTVVGGPGSFSTDIFAALRASGCVVEEIGGDGTDIATQLASV